jgi:hypothetical protein
MKSFKSFLIEDISISPTNLQPTTPYGPTNPSLTLQNMNDYLYNPIFNPTSQPPLASTWPYPNIATGAGSELYDARGYKRSLNRPIPMPKAPPAQQFNPNDPFWQTETGKWFLSQLAGMVDNWNNPEWWAQNSTYSYEDRYTGLQNLIRQLSDMIVGSDAQGNPLYVTPPNVQDMTDTRWRNLI